MLGNNFYMAVIFLDIDGVLNCATTKQQFNGVIGIDAEKVAIMKRILDETEASVVLSSTWRIDQDWRLALSSAGLPLHRFIGVTGRAVSRIRGEEIATWMEEHGVVDCYATIIDDDPDMLPGQPHFRTTWQNGLTNEIADAVIRHLKTKI